MDHWRKFAGLLVLDNGERWEPERFQNWFVEDLFSGVPEAWLIVPEANGKTTLLSGVALYWCAFKKEAAVPMAASSRDQCGLLLGQAIGFVRRSNDIAGLYRVLGGYRRIECLDSHGTIQVYAADERTGDGVIFDLGLLDELHRHRDLGLYRTWRGKLEKRGAQIAAISTAGEPGGEFEEMRERARTESPKVKVKGRHTRAAGPELILHEYALRPDDDPTDMRLVKQANPFSGITVESLTRKFASPTTVLPHWLRFVCNRPSRTSDAAVGEAEWAAAEVEGEEPKGPCDTGLDLGWKYDATAITPLFATDDGWLLGQARVITPPRDGTSLRPEVIQDALLELHAEHPIQRVVMDPSAGGEQLAAWLEDELGAEVVTHSQTNQPMTLAAARFLEGLRGGTLKHVHDPVLTRHVLNGVAKQLPDGAIKFVRPAESRSPGEAPKREIDALIAAAMVLSVAIGNQPEEPVNVDDYRIARL